MFVYTSYSQEGEDLLIQRLLQAYVFKMPRIAVPGRYIDIGAYRPIDQSNTYLFYTLGWRGVNVEPNPDYIEEFAEERPEDTTLNIAIAPADGQLLYHRFDNPLLNGFFGEEEVAKSQATGARRVLTVPVQCVGISRFLRDNASDVPTYLVSIDAETMDAPILAAWDWDLCRPAVLCAEIKAGAMEEVVDSEVAGILRRAGYALMSRSDQSAVFLDRKYL